MDNEKREFENTEFENSEIEEVSELENVTEVEADTEVFADDNGQAESETESEAEINSEEIISEDEVSAIEPALTEEEIQMMKAEKKRKNKKALCISAIVVAVVFVAGLIYSLCIMNSIGTKTVVNTSLPAKYSSAGEKLEEEKYNIKFENPFVSLFGGKNADILTVNGFGIGSDIFNYFVKSSALNYEYELYQNNTISDLKAFDWNAVNEETGLKNAEIAKGEAVKSVSSVLAVIAEAEKRGIALTEDEEKEISDWIEQVKTSYGDNLENALMQSGYDSVEQLAEMQKLQTLYQKAYTAFGEDPIAYVKQFKNYEKSLSSDKITVLHVLVKFPDGVTNESAEEEKAETKKKAEEVLAKAKAGEDFSSLIDTYNEDPGLGKYGYTFANDGSMVQEFADAAFALEIDGISDIVETNYGYHIIKRTERIPDFGEYLDLLEDNMKIRINRFGYSKLVVDADLSQYMGEETADTESSAE